MGQYLCFFLPFEFKKDSFLKAPLENGFALINVVTTSQLVYPFAFLRRVAFVAMCKCPKEKSVAAAYL